MSLKSNKRLYLCSIIYWILLPKAEVGCIKVNQCQVNSMWLELTYFIETLFWATNFQRLELEHTCIYRLFYYQPSYFSVRPQQFPQLLLQRLRALAILKIVLCRMQLFWILLQIKDLRPSESVLRPWPTRPWHPYHIGYLLWQQVKREDVVGEQQW